MPQKFAQRTLSVGAQWFFLDKVADLYGGGSDIARLEECGGVRADEPMKHVGAHDIGEWPTMAGYLHRTELSLGHRGGEALTRLSNSEGVHAQIVLNSPFLYPTAKAGELYALRLLGVRTCGQLSRPRGEQQGR